MKLLTSPLILLSLCPTFLAQQSLTRPTCRGCIRRSVKSPMPPTPTEFFVGEARVNVTKDETVVKLAMAQHASVLIELPANDGPRYIFPGDPDMATVDEKALDRNKRAIVVRPGTQFLPPLRNTKSTNPAATVTAQMRSGLVVTFLFYPVSDLAQNVHRCVLQYNRDEVVARRRAAGLPVNLDGTGQRGEMTEPPAAPTSVSVEDIAREKPKVHELPKPNPSSNWILDELPVPYVPDPIVTKERLASLGAYKALREGLGNPALFTTWTKPVHGISLSVRNSDNTSSDFSIAVVAIRNKSSKTLMLLADVPEVFKESCDKNGKPLNIESVKALHTQRSNDSNQIQPGQTVYYAIAYPDLVLNTNQQVRIQVSHTKAVNEPASIVAVKSR